jgi:hypothetical protein
MKKLIIWLAKVFKVNITNEKIIYKDKIVEKIIYKDRVIEHTLVSSDSDVYIKGNLLVEGIITVTGEIACYKTKGE